MAKSGRKGVVVEGMEREPRPPTHLGLFITGEVKKGKVSGFHNWIRFYLQEKEGLLDYYSHNYDGPVSTRAGGAEGVPGLPALPLPSKQSDLRLTTAQPKIWMSLSVREQISNLSPNSEASKPARDRRQRAPPPSVCSLSSGRSRPRLRAENKGVCPPPA